MRPTPRSRRQFLKLLAGVGASAVLTSSLSSCVQAIPQNQKPAVVPKPPPGFRYRGASPNTVMVVVDDLAAEVMGENGRFPFLETPHVSRLQREGATFERAFVPSSVWLAESGKFAYEHVPSYKAVLGEMRGALQQQLADTGYFDTQLASR